MDASNPVYSSWNGVLFDKAQTTLIQFPGGQGGNYTIPNSVTTIGNDAFVHCTGLTSVTIPESVTTIGVSAFLTCYGMEGVYFHGNAPGADNSAFNFADKATVYYLPGTTGWESTFAGRPTAIWPPVAQSNGPDFGVQGGRFGFSITWPIDRVVIVEAASDLVNPVWLPVSTNTLVGGTSHFSDPDWATHPARLYRLRAP